MENFKNHTPPSLLTARPLTDCLDQAVLEAQGKLLTRVVVQDQHDHSFLLFPYLVDRYVLPGVL